MDKLMNIGSALLCGLITTLIVGSIIFLLYFIIKKIRKEELRKMVVLKIYTITFFVLSGIMLIASLTPPNVAVAVIMVVLIIVGALFLLNKNKSTNNPMVNKMTGRKIKEMKCTCQACGNAWYYGKSEEWENKAKRLKNVGSSVGDVGKSMMCCSGCVPALFIPKDQQIEVKDLNKCSKCNSSAVKKEEVIHEI